MDKIVYMLFTNVVYQEPCLAVKIGKAHGFVNRVYETKFLGFILDRTVSEQYYDIKYYQ